jgi:two-component system sensor kinase FixL
MLPGVLIVGWVLIAIVISSSTADGLPASVSSWTGVLALLALYLLGPRYGALFAVLAVAQIGWSLALHHSGLSLPAGPPKPPPDSASAIFIQGLGIVMIAVIGYLYELAQKQTLGELSDALITSEQNERQLDALFESTTAAICSIDRTRCLITCNDVFTRMGAAQDGAGPARGAPLERILPPAQHARWQPHIEAVLAGDGPTTFEEPPPAGQDAPFRETTMHPIVAGERITGVTVFSRDITERKHSEAEMRRLHQELLRVSRESGMASVASEVLHNAGNVLNSAGVSVAMLERHLQGFRFGQLAKAVAILEEHAGHLDAFLRDDPRGGKLLELFRGLVAHFEQQQRQVGAEVVALGQSIEHLMRVIRAQQSHARTLGIVEAVTVDELIDAALDLQAPAWSQLGITIERHLANVPPIHVDRHKAIEILVNLISNARHALRDSGRPDQRLRIRAETAAPGSQRVRIHIEDNGIGIAPEIADKLFRLGFTTKPGGSGIGLHASANTAQQLGGSVAFHSAGPGQGAVFTLELPVTATPAMPGTAGPEPAPGGDARL